LLLAGVVVALAAITGAALLHEVAVAVRGATGGTSYQHASREAPAAGNDADEERLRDSLVGRPPDATRGLRWR